MSRDTGQIHIRGAREPGQAPELWIMKEKQTHRAGQGRAGPGRGGHEKEMKRKKERDKRQEARDKRD